MQSRYRCLTVIEVLCGSISCPFVYSRFGVYELFRSCRFGVNKDLGISPQLGMTLQQSWVIHEQIAVSKGFYLLVIHKCPLSAMLYIPNHTAAIAFD